MARLSKVPTEESGFFEPYSYYARTLRTWFVAYGVGGPAVIITHPETLSLVSKAGYVGWIGWLFLAGVAAQVVITLLNKVAMWYLYCGELQENFRVTLRYKASDWFSEQFWPDILMDVLTLAAFSSSTVMLFRIFTQVVTQN